MNIFQFKEKNKEKGYTLLFAVLTAALVLGVGAFILGIARKQYIISASARDSVYALYAADAAIECAVNAGATGWVDTDTPDVPCGNNNSQSYRGLAEDAQRFTFTAMIDKSSAPVELDQSKDIFQSNDMQFLLRDINQLDDPNIALDDTIYGCVNMKAWLGTDKEGVPRTVVEARGYNLCDVITRGPISGARTVERAMRVIE